MRLGKSKLWNGRVFYVAPYFLFINATEKNLLETLKKEGLSNIREKNIDSHEVEHKFYLCKWNQWTVLMDSWSYSMFHLNCEVLILDHLGNTYDTYQCVVGDCDYSFGFKCYQNGKVKRSFSVSNISMDKDDLQVEENFGKPFKNESLYFKNEGEYQKVMNIAYDLGLGFLPNPESIRCFVYELSQDLKLRIKNASKNSDD